MRQALLIVLPATPLPLWGCYGSFAELTPWFDSLAAEGITFDNFFLTASGNCEEAWRNVRQNISERVWLETHQILCEEAGLKKTVQEIESEILGQLENKNFSDSLTIVHLPEIPQALLPALPGEDAGQADAENDDEWDPDDEDPDDEEDIPGEFPRQILELDDQVAWERQVVWQDRIVEEILEIWKAGVADQPHLIVLTACRGNAYPFRSDVENRFHAECAVRLPCLVVDSACLYGGTRIQALTSTEDLIPTIADWMLTEKEPGFKVEKTWWPLIRGEVARLYEQLELASETGNAIRTESGLIVQEEEARYYFKPEDQWDLNDVAPEEPDLVEQELGRLVREDAERSDDVSADRQSRP